MRISTKISKMAFAGVLSLTLGASSAAVFAYPTTSPSALAAAHLKNHPPPNWIEHYLGDDRYKIKGGTWKVVSTENDTFYYPAWAPEMLRQPAGKVIGFPSSAAAEEAGYRRSNYPMDSPLLGLTGRGTPTKPGASTSMGLFSFSAQGMDATSNTGKARRVTLSDGASSAILPAGWTHLKQTHTVPGPNGTQRTINVDIFTPGTGMKTLSDPRNARFVAFAAQETPGMNAEKMFSGNLANNIRNSGRGGSVDSRVDNVLNNTRRVKFGNLTGTAISFPTPQYGKMSIVFAGKGSTAYFMADASKGAPGAKQVIDSYRVP